MSLTDKTYGAILTLRFAGCQVYRGENGDHIVDGHTITTAVLLSRAGIGKRQRRNTLNLRRGKPQKPSAAITCDALVQISPSEKFGLKPLATSGFNDERNA